MSESSSSHKVRESRASIDKVTHIFEWSLGKKSAKRAYSIALERVVRNCRGTHFHTAKVRWDSLWEKISWGNKGQRNAALAFSISISWVRRQTCQIEFIISVVLGANIKRHLVFELWCKHTWYKTYGMCYTSRLWHEVTSISYWSPRKLEFWNTQMGAYSLSLTFAFLSMLRNRAPKGCFFRVWCFFL